MAIYNTKKVFLIPIVFIIVVLITVYYLRHEYGLAQMESPTMEPIIHEKSNSSSIGDFILYRKHFKVSSLRSGDLVVVNLKTSYGNICTVRMIDNHSDSPSGFFYVVSVNQKKHGIDSSSLGAIPSSDIIGKVVHIIKR